MHPFSFQRHRAVVVFWSLALLGGCTTAPAAGPPKEPGPFREADLVEIVKLDPAIRLDVRYATPNNFTGRRVYREARAFLQPLLRHHPVDLDARRRE